MMFSNLQRFAWLALAVSLAPNPARAEEVSLAEAIAKAASQAAVQKVVVKDSVKNGALIGLAAGAAMGAWFGTFWMQYCENESSSCPTAPVIFGGLFGALGAGIGAGIDGLIHKRVPVTNRQPGNLTLAPVISRDRRGIQASLRF